jgi:hypothetical protein
MEAETPACVRAAKYPSIDPSRCAQRHRFRMANAQNIKDVDQSSFWHKIRNKNVKIPVIAQITGIFFFTYKRFYLFKNAEYIQTSFSCARM